MTSWKCKTVQTINILKLLYIIVCGWSYFHHDFYYHEIVVFHLRRLTSNCCIPPIWDMFCCNRVIFKLHSFQVTKLKKMIHKISDGSRSLNHPSVGWANNIPTNFPCGWTNPFEKICSSNWIMSPRFAVNIKKYLVTILMSNNPGSAGFAWRYLKPPPFRAWAEATGYTSHKK